MIVVLASICSGRSGMAVGIFATGAISAHWYLLNWWLGWMEEHENIVRVTVLWVVSSISLLD